jgi:hypothetical protein
MNIASQIPVNVIGTDGVTILDGHRVLTLLPRLQTRQAGQWRSPVEDVLCLPVREELLSDHPDLVDQRSTDRRRTSVVGSSVSHNMSSQRISLIGTTKTISGVGKSERSMNA